MTERYDAKEYAKLVRGVSNNKAKPVKTEEGYFGSQGEYRRYGQLKLLDKAGVIEQLRLHHKFPIVVNGVHIKVYTADFTYYDLREKQQIIEDHKGRRYREWILTKKLLKALYPEWRVIETTDERKYGSKKKNK